MTSLMEEAIERLRRIPADEQDEVARFVLNELSEDERWVATTNANEGKLEGLVDEVLAADARGECETLDPERP